MSALTLEEHAALRQPLVFSPRIGFEAPYPFRADNGPRVVYPKGTSSDPDYGPYTGHPLDPRTPEPTTLQDKLEAVRNALIELKAAELFYSRAVCADSLDDPERDERKGDADVATAMGLLAEHCAADERAVAELDA